jgi:hypothetical protein
MKLRQLYKDYQTGLIKSRFIGYDAVTGKVLFDSLRDRDHAIAVYGECDILAIWSEILTERGSGYFQIARPTIKITLGGVSNNENQ